MGRAADIRLGAASDLPAVAGVHLVSSRVAYRGICPDAILDALTMEGRIDLWRRRYDGLGPEGRLWISQRPEIVGFAATDAAAGGDPRKRACELLSFYVLPDWWGRKVGQELMQWLLDDLRERRFDDVLLWTIQANRRARDFYEKAGFACDHLTRTIARRESGVLVEYDEIRYSRALLP